MGNTENMLSPHQQQAIYMIKHLAGIARKLDNEKSKILIRAKIADLLWRYDEAQSRALFEEVFTEANAAFDQAQKGNDGDLSRNSPVLFQLQLLQHVLSLIAQHDDKLAETFMKSVTDTRLMLGQGSKSVLSLQMAIMLAETNPERAAQITNNILNSGFIPMIGNVLVKLQPKNPQLAESLFMRALSVARRDPSSSFIIIRALSRYVFPSLEEDSLEAVMGRNQGVAPVNSHVCDQFLSFVYDTLVGQISVEPGNDALDPLYSRNKPDFDYQTISKLLPFFDQFMPDKSDGVRSRLTEMARGISSPQIELNGNSSGSESKVQELLSKA